MNWRVILSIAIGVLIFTGCCSSCRKYQKLRKPLVGTEWHLVQMDGERITPSEESSKGGYTLILGDNGNIGGVGACNTFMGSYEASAERNITISVSGSTRRMCRDHANEQRYFEMLQSATHYDMDGPMLLLLKDGYLIAIFESRE